VAERASSARAQAGRRGGAAIYGSFSSTLIARKHRAKWKDLCQGCGADETRECESCAPGTLNEFCSSKAGIFNRDSISGDASCPLQRHSETPIKEGGGGGGGGVEEVRYRPHGRHHLETGEADSKGDCRDLGSRFPRLVLKGAFSGPFPRDRAKGLRQGGGDSRASDATIVFQ